MKLNTSIQKLLTAGCVIAAMYAVCHLNARAVCGQPVSHPRHSSPATPNLPDGLLQESNFKYVGAFRVPRGEYGRSRFGYSGTALAFSPNEVNDSSDDSLFISGHAWDAGCIAEISIPQPVVGKRLADLSVCEVLQNFDDITEGKLKQIVATNSVTLAGILVDGDQLIWTGLSYYDASHKADRSHGTSSLKLSQAGDATGMFRVGAVNPGFVAGYMAHVPRPWQEKLGASLLTGQSNVPIITRTSAGPAAFGFNANQFSPESMTPAIPFLGNGYQREMKLKNEGFNFNSSIGGMVFPKESRSIVFFGGHGLGDVCYGTNLECQDPDKDSKGWHDQGGNYVYQVWAYDVKDFLAVKNGSRRADQVRPYAIWNPEFPQPVGHACIGGVAYDNNTNRIYVVQLLADRGDNGQRTPQPLIHVYQIQTELETQPAINVKDSGHGPLPNLHDASK